MADELLHSNDVAWMHEEAIKRDVEKPSTTQERIEEQQKALLPVFEAAIEQLERLGFQGTAKNDLDKRVLLRVPRLHVVVVDNLLRGLSLAELQFGEVIKGKFTEIPVRFNPFTNQWVGEFLPDEHRFRSPVAELVAALLKAPFATP